MSHYKKQLALQSRRRKELLIEQMSGEAVVLSKVDGIWYCHCLSSDSIETDVSDGHCLHHVRLSDIDPHLIAKTICNHFDHVEILNK